MISFYTQPRGRPAPAIIVPRHRRMEWNAAEGALEEGESARAVATARARVRG